MYVIAMCHVQGKHILSCRPISYIVAFLWCPIGQRQQSPRRRPSGPQMCGGDRAWVSWGPPEEHHGVLGVWDERSSCDGR